jgi:RHS repeat-associated protein
MHRKGPKLMFLALFSALAGSLLSPSAAAQCFSITLSNTQLVGGAAGQSGVGTINLLNGCQPSYIQLSYNSTGSVVINKSTSYLTPQNNTATFTYYNPSVVSKPETVTFVAWPGCCGAYVYSPPVNIVPNPLSFTISPSSFVGNSQGTGTVQLQYPTLGAQNVGLSPFCCVFHVPNGVTIAAGQTTATFSVSGSTVSSPQQVLETASVVANDGNTTATQTVSVLPMQSDLGPCSKHCEEMAGNPINLVNGNTWVQQNDYALPGTGGGMQLARTWNSLWPSSQPPASAGVFGQGWWSTYEERLTWPSNGVIYYWRGDGSYWCFGQTSTPGNYTLISPADERASLQSYSGLSFTLTLKDGSTRQFSANGYLLSITDRNSNQTTITYNGSNIATVTDPAGRVLTFNYANPATPNQASSVQDSTGVIAAYTYDSNSNLTQVTYADGSSLTMAYDSSNQLNSVSDKNGKLLEAHTYDSSRRGLTSTKANGVDAISLQYGAGQTQLYNSKSNSMTYYWGNVVSRNLITSLTSNVGCDSCGIQGTWTFQYDSSGNRTSSTDGLGRVTNYTYDANANMLSRSIQLTSSQTLTWSYTYNQFGDVLTATDPLENVTTNSYDSNGNLLSTTTPSPDGVLPGSVTSFTYDSAGHLLTITDPLNNKTTMSYTPAGLLASVTDAQHNVSSFSYDLRCNRLSMTDAANNTTAYTYDLGNHLTSITYPDTTTASFTYDSRGRRTSATDQDGKTTTYGYDDADRLTNVTDAATNLTQYAYDTENNLTSITDALHRVTSFSYDQNNRVSKATFPSSSAETYSYDSVGNLLSKTDRKSQTIQYAYDALNRLTSKTYPGGAAVNYTYDGNSHLAQASDSTGTFGFTYDNLGRLIGTSTQYTFVPGTFTNSYTYDAASNRTGFTAPDGSTNTYAYDMLNRLSTLSNPWAGSFGFSYDALGRRTQMTRPDNVTTTYTYDSLSRLLSVLHQAGGSTLDGATYSLDSAGNRMSKTDLLANVTTNYGYDAIYELLSATGGSTETYSYDSVGNRLSSLTGSFSSNSSNELTSSPSASYTYDANGNTTGKTDSAGTTTYSWDFENRLTSVTLPGTGGTTSFRYDPFGRRVQKVGQRGTTNFVYDGANIVAEYDSAGALLAKYARGNGVDEPLSMSRGGTIAYYSADGLGSVTSLEDGTGSVIASYTYDSFGNLISPEPPALVNSFRYTGREWDQETGLFYYRARYYDPQIGHFISEDPINFDGGMNFYAYVGNGPTNFTDPFGLAKCNYQIAAHTLVCMSDNKPPVGPPYGVQVGPDSVASGGRMQGPTSCTNNNKCQNNRFEGPIVPGYYKMNYDTRPVHQGMDVYRLQSWPHKWYDGLAYDLRLSRGGFELHLGTISLGCINVDKRNPAAAQQYHQMNQLLRSEDGSNYLTVVP